MKKKILTIILSVVMILSITSCKKEEKDVVYVYNWGEYIDESLLRDFENETGIKVVYEVFEQNEDMYMKLKNGGSNYDVVVPSDYMIERMISEDMLDEIDKEKIPNLKNITEEFLNEDYDPEGKYSIPYLWGTVGIVYNSKLVDEEVDSWDILWNEKYKDEIIMMNSTRDSIGISLIKNNYSMNSRNIDELNKAKEDLIKQKPLVFAYLVDETKSQMVNGEAKLAVMYSGDALTAMDENEDLRYVVPKEGSNIWFDSMCIPRGAKNKENAEKFINYILRPEVSAAIGEYVGYSLPNKEGIKLLPEEMQNNEVAYPDLKKLPKMEVFKDPKDINPIYDDIWAEVKLSKYD